MPASSTSSRTAAARAGVAPDRRTIAPRAPRRRRRPRRRGTRRSRAGSGSPRCVDDEHLGLAVAVGAHADHRRGATDGSLVHGAHPRRSTPYCVRGKRSGRRDPSAHPRRRARSRSRRSWSSRCTGRAGSTSDPPVGADGDFVTSPHVHPAFGMFLARALARARRRARLAEPAPDHRGGRRRRDARPPDPRRARRAPYTAVEVSAGARAALREIDGIEVAERLDRSRRRGAGPRAPRQPPVPTRP